jgi:hypothetical protein
VIKHLNKSHHITLSFYVNFHWSFWQLKLTFSFNMKKLKFWKFMEIYLQERKKWEKNFTCLFCLKEKPMSKFKHTCILFHKFTRKWYKNVKIEIYQNITNVSDTMWISYGHKIWHVWYKTLTTPPFYTNFVTKTPLE